MLNRSIWALGLLLYLSACNQQPTVLEGDTEAAKGIFNSEEKAPSASPAAEEHRVFLIDTLAGSRYSYLKVKEGEKEFWLATLKTTYTLGEEYVFKQGIYKTDYYSTSFERTFDEIYLVSDLRPAFSNPQKNALDQMFKTTETPSAEKVEAITPMEGGISIKELIQNADRYVNQEVILSVKVVKINANIMDRHWLHLKDGSFDSFDLVATSQTAVPAGHTVNLKAVLHKDVDFGAGYSYDLILENAELIP